MPVDRVPLWCAKCAKKHHGDSGAIDLHNKMCEDCLLKVATYGTIDAATQKHSKRWCATCQSRHEGAVLPPHKRKGYWCSAETETETEVKAAEEF